MNVMRNRSSWRLRLGTFLSGFMLAVLATGSASANVNIANSPLFVTSGVEPNIMFIIDDSGSMMFEVTPDDLAFPSSNAYAGYVFPRANNVYGPSDYAQNFLMTATVDANVAYTAITRSHQFNTTYYNPATTYTPWIRADGTLYPSASPTCAFHNPEGTGTCPTGSVNENARNLTTNNGRYNNNQWRSCNSAGSCNASTADKTFWPATYYFHNGGSEWTWGNYTRVEIRSTTTTYSGHGRANRTDCTAGVCTYAQEIQNFANWYTYYRSRILAARAGIGKAFSDYSDGMRVGYGAINAGSTSVDSVSTTTIVRGVRPFSGANRNAFYNELYTRDIPALGTPLRRALDAAGQYFSRTDARGPWSSTPGTTGGTNLECRQSYTILMTDGYWTGGTGSDVVAATAAARANVDNSNGPTITGPGAQSFRYTPAAPFNDNYSNTLADIAMYYWNRDLRTDIANRVPVGPFNEAFWQHMVTFGVGLGVAGSVAPADAWAAAANGTAISWANPGTGVNCSGGECEARLDDLLHAAVNSRGGFFSAADPETFALELAKVLEDIVARVDSSATSAATSSAVLQTDTLLYTAGFRSGDWSGRLDARAVNADGSIGALVWDAEQQLALKAPATRNIITRRPDTGVAVPFTWANLSLAQRNALNRNPSGANDALGEARVAWLRGDNAAHATFRQRVGPSGELRLLGDIVNSNPKFESGVLYVGANDGMLHAFDAETGVELFAYVPSAMLTPDSGDTFAPLSRLMDPNYLHRYFVDGTMSVVDLTISGVAKKILVGSLGAGGRTVFALDVTNPTSFSAGDVLWEFSHPELGYNVGPPAIVQLSDGTLAALFGNGYNANSHRAMLFAVNLNTGALIQTIDTGIGSAASPNGLAAPVVTDWPVSNLRANRVYAGDLQGNMWRFNVGGPTSAWNDAGNKTAIFTATGPTGNVQPITAAPVLALNPDNNNEVVIAFGTGSYFRAGDQTMPGPVQSLYGIRDNATGVTAVTRADLLEQEVTQQTIETFGSETIGVRIVSDNEFDTSVHMGWYLDLDVEPGERVISDATYPTGPLQRRVRFSTLIPDDNPCGTGRRGFIMDLDIVAGGRTAYSVFDLNRDGRYDDLDKVGDSAISGVAWGQGEQPTVLTPPDTSGDPPEFLYTGEGEYVKGLGEEGLGGRQSWQQLR